MTCMCLLPSLAVKFNFVLLTVAGVEGLENVPKESAVAGKAYTSLRICPPFLAMAIRGAFYRMTPSRHQLDAVAAA